MNNRIKELEKQCWDNQTNHLNAEKFAELIVRECADVVAEHYDASEPWITPKTLLYHFGVEE
jgi:hypothetical protein